jgi:hypothetical protein
MKKEELIAENARLQSKLREVESDFSGYSETARENLAVTLGLNTQKQSAYGYKEKNLPEWSEIYARIGELRTLARQKDQSEQLRYFEEMINKHELQLNETTHEK